MSKMRVHELAKELKTTSKELLGILEQLKIDAKSHMSVLEDDTVAVVRDLVTHKDKPAKPSAPAAVAAPAPAEAVGKAASTPASPKAPKYVKGAKPVKPAPYQRRGRGKEPFEIGERSTMVIRIDSPLSLKELALILTVNPTVLIKQLMNEGFMVNINQEIDVMTARKIARDLGFKLEEAKPVEKGSPVLEKSPATGVEPEGEDPTKLQFRPPVVTVMGHVDHGKTSLLDVIRQTNVTEHEAGGITQHIGAYQVDLKGKKIVFIDTPGHEAFTAMRARGAQATDIAILVVAADDGIMPQTVEAINHAKAARVPIVVAINKIDRHNANVDKVKQQLTEYGLVSEEWGGDTVIVPVSAKEKIGIESLLEMILLVAEMQEIKADPDRLARGIIIEAELDKGRGPVATVLIKSGTLRVGDGIVAGLTYGRVRAMIDDKGKGIRLAGPSAPVAVLGLSDVPQAGDQMFGVEDEKHARLIVEAKRNGLKEEEFNKSYKVTLDNLFARIKEGTVKDLNIVIKADVQGSVEAVKQSLEKLTNSNVRVNVIHGGVGTITESDIMLASASNAIIIGFNVRPDPNARKVAEVENVDVRSYRIIYEAIDDIKAAMEGMLEPEFREVVLGRAAVRALFKVPKAGTIAGCQVQDGKITRNAQVRVIRNTAVVHQGVIDSLKRFKDDVREVLAGFECGIGLDKFNDLKEGDILEAYAMQEVK